MHLLESREYTSSASSGDTSPSDLNFSVISYIFRRREGSSFDISRRQNVRHVRFHGTFVHVFRHSDHVFHGKGGYPSDKGAVFGKDGKAVRVPAICRLGIVVHAVFEDDDGRNAEIS